MAARRRIGVLVAAMVALAATAPPAGASIFFDNAASSIGRVSADGKQVKPTLVRTAHPWAVAANRKYVYWARLYCCGGKTQYIGRARHDGSHAQQAFLTLPGISRTQGGIDSLAVDSRHVYWTNGNLIGRANLDGSNVQQAFIAFAEFTQNVSDLRVSDGKLYFRVSQLVGVQRLSIGRANTDGTHVLLDLIPGIEQGAGLAVDRRHIYWDQGGNVKAIARADLDGSHVERRFIDTSAQGIAVGGGHVYWSSFPSGVIGRARIDGTHVERRFARGVKRAHTLAVVPDR